jgi:ABC-type branched-subunit amino acid transport system substrate-binding protein
MRPSPSASLGKPLQLFLLAGLMACGGDGGEGAGDVPGVDLENKVIRIGIINDLSGPAASIGRPIQIGYEMLYRQINAGGSGLLPEGWTVQWVTRDHGYNPQQSVQMYNEISEDVLFLGMSFGTATTLPLHPMLARDHMLAVPASLSSRTGRNEYTPPPTATYRTEAMRAVDWAVEQVGPSAKIGIVYQQDDYGEDGVEGLEVEAGFHGVEIVSKQAIAPGQADFTAVVSALQSAGAEYVMLPILPSATGPLLGTAAQLGYRPVWMGNGPSWLDAFFDPAVVPPTIFESYYLVSSAPYWGEDVTGMPAFLEAYQAYGASEMEPDSYILAGYLFASVGIETVRRAFEIGDLTRGGLTSALHTIDRWDINGLYPPIGLTSVPYDATRQVRVTRPVMEERTWEVMSDYAAPDSDAGSR